jgi:RNAse (barnase) inhibitor barstar
MRLKDIYKAITDTWQFAKKYLTNIDKNESDEYWQKLMRDCDKIYEDANKQDEDLKIFIQDITKAVVQLLTRLADNKIHKLREE